MFNINEFLKERDETLLSLDKEKITQYGEKYRLNFPKNELAFWAGVHKAILYLNSATDEQKEKSKAWLMKNGFKPEINFHGGKNKCN